MSDENYESLQDHELRIKKLEANQNEILRRLQRTIARLSKLEVE